MITPTFDDRDGFIWFDGTLVPWRDAHVHILTHAMHYGSSVFEGERCYNNRIFKVEAHNDRLFRSAEILDMTIPFSKEVLLDARQEVLKANTLSDAYLRPLVWRGPPENMGIGGLSSKIHVMIAAWHWGDYYAPEKAAKGLMLRTSKWRRPSPQTAPVQSKAAGGYMIGTLARHESLAAGYDDALMLDWQGRVAEATGANLFMIKDGVLYTPPPECSLNGITRLTVIDLARKLGRTVEEKFFSYDDLIAADEAFLTGTAAELQRIGRIDDHQYGDGPITLELKDAYSRLVRG